MLLSDIKVLMKGWTKKDWAHSILEIGDLRKDHEFQKQ